MEMNQLALVLVDIQRDFWHPLEEAGKFPRFPDNIRRLLRTARANHLRVVHTHAVFKTDKSDWMLFYRPGGCSPIPCIAGSGGERVEEFAAPQPGETVIVKHYFDGFVNTDLESVLRRWNIKALLIAGLVTSVCVLFTATSAYLKRFVPMVVRDGCADELEKHEATLRFYAGLCFQCVTVEQIQNDLAMVIQLAERYVDAAPDE